MHGHESIIKPPEGDPGETNSGELFDVSQLSSCAGNKGKLGFYFENKNTIETSRMKTESLQDIRPFFEKFLENLLRENIEKSET